MKWYALLLNIRLNVNLMCTHNFISISLTSPNIISNIFYVP